MKQGVQDTISALTMLLFIGAIFTGIGYYWGYWSSPTSSDVSQARADLEREHINSEYRWQMLQESQSWVVGKNQELRALRDSLRACNQTILVKVLKEEKNG